MKVDLPEQRAQVGNVRSAPPGKRYEPTLLLPKSAFIERGELASLFVVGSDRVARLAMGQDRPYVGAGD
jgi:hypothetical protein